MDKGNKSEEDERTPNRLINEKSPYLLQHAYNPVDWYPWEKEAFEKAQREGKPIFLSIGYSTCHWCHVMAHESFEDPEVARLMNETFISVKVDREERPDIDSIYMSACQAMTGSGGWPLTIIMIPEGKPFFAATYIPKDSRYDRIGMLDLIPQVKHLWQDQKEKAIASAEELTGLLKRVSTSGSGEPMDKEVLDRAERQLSEIFDEVHGGFGRSPKFPAPHNLLFLLRHWKRTGDEKFLSMVEKTLQEMRLGGIYDHLGFGFHRYSTDERWFLPHFEKMLYDQAMLVMTYVEAYQATGGDEYKETAEEILAYILRDMTSPEGGFYSAEDADSEGVEGEFYVWSEAKIRKLLPKGEAELVIKVFNVEEHGNFIEEATKEKTGKNILHLKKALPEISRELDIPLKELKDRLEDARKKLFDAREKRVHPGKDDKILTDW
ncbi:MAG: thioredoxin domain-containing protein, partial [Candidatus Hydrothermarchaeales archaeon]